MGTLTMWTTLPTESRLQLMIAKTNPKMFSITQPVSRSPLWADAMILSVVRLHVAYGPMPISELRVLRLLTFLAMSIVQSTVLAHVERILCANTTVSEQLVCTVTKLTSGHLQLMLPVSVMN